MIAGSRRPRPRLTSAPLRGCLAVIAFVLLGALLAACSSSARVAETDSVVSRVAFMDGEVFEYRLIDRDGEVAGTGTFTTDRDDGAWLLTQTYENTDGVVVDESRVVVDAMTLQPRSTERVIVRNGATEVVTAVYDTNAEGGRTVRTTQVTHVQGGDERERTIDINDHDYEDQSSLWLWRTLALGEGLDLRYTTVDPREGGRVTANVVQGRPPDAGDAVRPHVRHVGAPDPYGPRDRERVDPRQSAARGRALRQRAGCSSSWSGRGCVSCSSQLASRSGAYQSASISPQSRTFSRRIHC